MMIAILSCLLVFVGILYMVGATERAKRLLLVVIVLAIVLPVIVYLFQGFKLWWLVVLGVVLLVAALWIFRFRFLKVLFSVLAAYLKVSYLMGCRLVELLTVFPPVLLPLPERLLVAIGGIAMVQSMIVIVVCLAMGSLHRGVIYCALAILVWTLLFGLLGKWRFLRKERKGLAHV